jgi:hypothetical protein
VIDSQVYCIVWGSYVRIGSAADPIDRLANIAETPPPQRRGNPELVGTVPGGFGVEGWLTAAFARHRTVGGWYHLTGPVADLVDAAARSGVDDLAPRVRRGAAPVRMRTGDALFVVTSARGAIGERREHLMLMPEKTPAGLRLIAPQPALCGAGVTRVVAPFAATLASVSRCRECARGVPARSR